VRCVFSVVDQLCPGRAVKNKSKADRLLLNGEASGEKAGPEKRV
jgi:hypothetical protein